MKRKQLILWVLLTGMFCAGLRAQGVNYPVSATTVFYPPYPSSVQALSAASLPSIVLTINNKSANASVLNALIVVTIKTKDFTASTSQISSGYSVSLIGNTPVRLTNLDMTALFNYGNLSGITMAQYQNALPQSNISFVFTVYDAVTRRQISDNASYTYTYSINTPPTLFAPSNGATQIEQGMQNILFQWQPRQVAAFKSIEYVLEIVQLLTDAQDPQSAFYGNPLFFADSTFSNTYLYGAANPPLLPGRSYAWRVRAKSFDNGDNSFSSFLNNGYSNVYAFKYSADCKVPGELVITRVDTASAWLSWKMLGDRQSFVVSYRKVGDAWIDLPRVSSRSTQLETILFNLRNKTSYQVKVKAFCADGTMVETTPVLFTTQKFKVITASTVRDAIRAVCGQIPAAKRLDETNLLKVLKENDIIKAGDFPITVGSGVTGSNGVFSGSGEIEIWIGKAMKLPVKFQQLKINSLYEMVDGYFAIGQ